MESEPAARGSQPHQAFMRSNKRQDLKLSNYRELHAWSVAEPALFWDLIWDFCGVIGVKGERRLIDGDKMPGASFFPDARLNFAENLLRRADDSDALVFRGEDKARDPYLAELKALCPPASAGRRRGNRKAPRAAMMRICRRPRVMLPASLAPLVVLLPDFVEPVLDRFSQFEPAAFRRRRGYWYNVKRIDRSGGSPPSPGNCRRRYHRHRSYLGGRQRPPQYPRAGTLKKFLQLPAAAARLEGRSIPALHLIRSARTGCRKHRAGRRRHVVAASEEHRLHATAAGRPAVHSPPAAG